MIAHDKAAEWRRRYPAGDWGAAMAMARRLKTPVNILPLKHGVPEMYYEGEIWIEEEQDRCSRLWYLIHALGHLVMHKGDQQWLRENGHGLVADKQEEQAERFAAYFLAPTLADLFRLPPDKRAYRISLETICGVWAA